MSKLYVSPPSRLFPVRANTRLHSALTGWPANRLLPRTVYKEDKTQPWTVGFHAVYYTSDCSNVKQICGALIPRPCTGSRAIVHLRSEVQTRLAPLFFHPAQRFRCAGFFVLFSVSSVQYRPYFRSSFGQYSMQCYFSQGNFLR